MSYPLYWTTTFSNLINVAKWQPPQPIIYDSSTNTPFSSPTGPALCSFKDKLWCAWPGGDIDGGFWTTAFDQDNGWGGSWGCGEVPQNTSSRLALCVLDDGNLYCAFQTSSQDDGTPNLPWLCSTFDPSITWNEGQSIPSNTLSAGPTLTTYQRQTYYIYRGTDANLYSIYGQGSPPSSWFPAAPMDGQSTSASPAAAPFNYDQNQVVWCVYRGNTNDSIYCTTSNFAYNMGPTSWNSPGLDNPISGTHTDAGPALCYLPDQHTMLCVYGGSGDNTIWYTYSNGNDPTNTNWSTPAQIPSVSRASGTEVGLAVYKGSVFVVYCGTS